jgi:hypothetical protein
MTWQRPEELLASESAAFPASCRIGMNDIASHGLPRISEMSELESH